MNQPDWDDIFAQVHDLAETVDVCSDQERYKRNEYYDPNLHQQY